MWSIIIIYHQINMAASDYVHTAVAFMPESLHTQKKHFLKFLDIYLGLPQKMVCVLVCVCVGESVPCPELQCFISDYQLTRDAALHRGPQV